MLFSLITVTYNAERYLQETLASVAEQTLTDFEHIIWDGGSHDNTLKIAESFPHVRIVQGVDEGIGDAMNKGAQQARGEFLWHLHADDRLAHPDVLAMCKAAIKQHPSFSWFYGGADVIDASGDVIRTLTPRPFDPRRLRRYNTLTHPATFLSRSLFQEAGGFQKQWRFCMDYDLWLRLAQKTSPFCLHTPLAAFREHSDSLSTSAPIAVADEAYQVRNRFVESFGERLRSYRTWKRRRKKLLELR